MSGESPNVILYDVNGQEMSVSNGSAIPTGTSALMIAGSDGTDSRFFTLDTSGRVVVVGAGTAGTPVGGVLTIQGISSGTAVPTSNLSIGATAASPPTDATYMGGSVTTAAPTYTTAQMDPLSLTTGGLLRIDGVYPLATTTPTSDVTFVGGAVTTAAPTYTTGQLDALSLDTTGNLRVLANQTTAANLLAQVGGLGAAGSALVGNPVQVGGSDGTDTRTLLTDASGRQIVVGAAAGGAAVVGNPVLSGGSDGTDARTMLTDTSGRQIMVGAAADGTAVTGNPVLMAGQDGTDVQSILTDTSGRLQIVGAAAAGAAAAGNPVQDGAVFNTTAPAPATGQIEPLQTDQASDLLTFPGVQFIAGAAWTSATAVNTLQYANGTTTIGQVSGAAAILVQLDQTTTLTGGAVTIQGTYDNINWVTVPATQVVNPQTFGSLTNPYTFVASTNQPFLILTRGFIAIRLNLTTVITGTGSVTPYWSKLSVSPPVPTFISTYSASFRSLTLAATATDFFTVTGSATKTIRILRMNISAIQTTAASQEFLVLYRTTANTGGTSATLTDVPYDSSDAAGSATVRSYTANPTGLGTSAGSLQTIKIFINEGGAGSPEDYTFDFTNGGTEQGIVLRGATDVLSLNWNGAAVPAGLNIDGFVVWTEE